MSKTLWSVLVLVIVIIVPWQLGWFNNLLATPTTNNHPSLITVTSPQAGDSISSPLTLTGTARGYWFFEATAPVTLESVSGEVLAESYITATDPWMTEDFVNFTGQLKFNSPQNLTAAKLIFKKDNPSSLSEHDDRFVIPVTLKNKS